MEFVATCLEFSSLCWLPRRAYKVDARRCAELVDGLLYAKELRVDHDAVARAALTANRAGLDFADAIIAELGRAAGCDHPDTFDQRAARDGAMHLLSPRHQPDS
ncbi:MAG: hypothetical protein L0H96_02030 [Humibacillus sp.]|nr:hypothetical protein [Humibacillus sp.]MDN5775671.1 hypothetical protein [Humibacillus sp.]